jgi:hypothetical protein
MEVATSVQRRQTRLVAAMSKNCAKSAPFKGPNILHRRGMELWGLTALGPIRSVPPSPHAVNHISQHLCNLPFAPNLRHHRPVSFEPGDGFNIFLRNVFLLHECIGSQCRRLQCEQSHTLHCSLKCSQNYATGHYAEIHESIPQIQKLFLNNHVYMLSRVLVTNNAGSGLDERVYLLLIHTTSNYMYSNYSAIIIYTLYIIHWYTHTHTHTHTHTLVVSW